MCSQKPDCFPGWDDLNPMTLSERRMFPLSCHFIRNLSHPWSAVMEGRTQDAKKTDRKDIRELLGRVISSVDQLPRRVPISGSGSNCPSDLIWRSTLRRLDMYRLDVLRRCLGSGALHPVRVFRESLNPKVLSGVV
jgi:hypothetical protein